VTQATLIGLTIAPLGGLSNVMTIREGRVLRPGIRPTAMCACAGRPGGRCPAQVPSVAAIDVTLGERGARTKLAATRYRRTEQAKMSRTLGELAG